MSKSKVIYVIRIIAKGLIFIFVSIAAIILIVNFIYNGIDWIGFVEFVASILLLIYLIDKISVRIPGLFEIKNEIGEVKKELGNLVSVYSKSEAKATAKSEFHEHHHYNNVSQDDLSSDAAKEKLKTKNN
jgi:hypothetical protein